MKASKSNRMSPVERSVADTHTARINEELVRREAQGMVGSFEITTMVMIKWRWKRGNGWSYGTRPVSV